MTSEQRDRAIDLLANRWLESMSLKDLEVFFYETQAEYLTCYNDADLLGELEDYMEDSEYEEFINEA